MRLPRIAAVLACSPLLLTQATWATEVDYRKFPSFHFYLVEGDEQPQKQAKLGNEVPAIDASAISPVNRVHVVEQGLREFLLLAGQRNGVRIVTAGMVRGTIREMDLPVDLDAMLDTLAAQYDLSWYRENGTITISPAGDSVSRVIYLGRMRIEDLRKSVGDAGLAQDNIEMSHVADANSVLVRGPAQLVAKIELIAEAFNKRNSGVRIIRRGKDG